MNRPNQPERYFLLVFFSLNMLVSSFSQSIIDKSAISIYLEITDTLSADRDPSSELWLKMADHPAYQHIEKAGNRMTYLKTVLPLVYMPSNSEKLKALLEGKENVHQYMAEHLIEAKKRRKKLEKYLKSEDFDYYSDAWLVSLVYLPDDINDKLDNLKIYLALFEDNGFGGRSITVDLLHLYNSGKNQNMDFLAHEFHHTLRDRSLIHIVYYPEDTLFTPIISALNKLPLEGVASILDKSKYFQDGYYDYVKSKFPVHAESVQEFVELVNNVSQNMAAIDSVLMSDLSQKEKANQIFKNLPWGGHAIGFYMARAIEQVHGRDKLILAQYDVREFLKLYQIAAEKEDSLYLFSEESVNYIASIN